MKCRCAGLVEQRLVKKTDQKRIGEAVIGLICALKIPLDREPPQELFESDPSCLRCGRLLVLEEAATCVWCDDPRPGKRLYQGAAAA